MKLSGGKDIHPFLRVVGTENAEIGFNFLIGPFSLSVSLRVIHGGEFDIILKKACKFSGKGGCELWASVRDQRVVKTEMFEHMVEEKSGYTCSIYGF